MTISPTSSLPKGKYYRTGLGQRARLAVESGSRCGQAHTFLELATYACFEIGDNPHTQPSGAYVQRIYLCTSPHTPVSAWLILRNWYHRMARKSKLGRRVAARRLSKITDFLTPMGPVSSVGRASSCCAFLLDDGYSLSDTDKCITSNSGVCSSVCYIPDLMFSQIKMKEANDMSS